VPRARPVASPKRTFLEDWAPPRLLRLLRTRPATPRAGSAAEAGPEMVVETAEPVDPRWSVLTDRTLSELRETAEVYRPTNFWGPGLEQLLADLRSLGLARFKSWPTATFWFYPVYGDSLSPATIGQLYRRARVSNPRLRKAWFRAALVGFHEARRDFDAARLAWQQQHWPMNLEAEGESGIGHPPQHFRLAPQQQEAWGRPYLNYLLCLAALSRHVDKEPTSFLEIGGGFGVLGEIVLARSDTARYVNVDIPPLVTVSSYYLTELFGHERVLTYDERVPSTGPIDVPDSACLPNWRLEDVSGPFDVFVNSYSFQEMEPPVVEHYVDAVCRMGVEYVVSLNSIAGKPKATDGDAVGVLDPVTSRLIIELFERRGYDLLGTYNRPLIVSAGEIAVLRRRR